MTSASLVSGGVDSSVALAIARETTPNITAFYLKVWLQNEFVSLGDCPWEEDLSYARSVCKQLNVPLEVLPLQSEYWELVVGYMIRELRAGRTPNPDIHCNSMIKFDAFLRKAKTNFKSVVTGHYAGVLRTEDGSRSRLFVARDQQKDQTYFLSLLSQSQLGLLELPLSNLLKSEVRDLAKERSLLPHNRKDSQGLCFLGKIKFRDFVRFHLGEWNGNLINTDTGELLGEHKGHWFYTIGQRQGLGLSGGPWYVTQKDAAENIVYLSQKSNVLSKGRSKFTAEGCHWFVGPPNNDRKLQVKIRHGPECLACSICLLDGGDVEVRLDKPELGVASGQFAVFYDENECLGSGVIGA